jgi:integrase
MPKPLTDPQIRRAKPREKPFKLSDGNATVKGLSLLVTPAGSKLWRFRYRQPGKQRDERAKGGPHRGRRESMVSLGEYPAVSLEKAREKALAARAGLADNITPVEAERAKRAQLANTFQEVATEWLEKRRKKFAAKTLTKCEWTFDTLVFPFIGSRPVAQLTAHEILHQVLNRLEARGKHETAHRTRQRISQVLRYAIATSRITGQFDVTRDLQGALTPLDVVHHASLKEPAEVGELLRAIDGYAGEPATRCALRLAALTFVRPGELRAAVWSEFNLDGKNPIWLIPGPRMKMKLEHHVPLSRQAVAVLRELQPFTGHGKYLFPSLRGRDRCMSDNTLNAALRRLGYTNQQMTAHGFRSMASTMLNSQLTDDEERRFDSDWIERQLAHVEPNAVRAAYNSAQHLPERRRMLQWWADYLDELKAAK